MMPLITPWSYPNKNTPRLAKQVTNSMRRSPRMPNCESGLVRSPAARTGGQRTTGCSDAASARCGIEMERRGVDVASTTGSSIGSSGSRTPRGRASGRAAGVAPVNRAPRDSESLVIDTLVSLHWSSGSFLNVSSCTSSSCGVSAPRGVLAATCGVSRFEVRPPCTPVVSTGCEMAPGSVAPPSSRARALSATSSFSARSWSAARMPHECRKMKCTSSSERLRVSG